MSPCVKVIIVSLYLYSKLTSFGGLLVACWWPSPFCHGRRSMGGHGLPKVSTGPAMPYPSPPCGRATPDTALRQFQGKPTHRAAACGHLLPLRISHAVRLWPSPFCPTADFPDIHFLCPKVQCSGVKPKVRRLETWSGSRIGFEG
jgi:hypothetical protein